jgi:tetratricopeptide (TPR) repeat protein
MGELSIGIHIIVKDEEELLRQCLESIQGADEIIVVDTGSEDNSSVLAEAYGAKVVKIAWQDSFSYPRNEALRYANTDWILYLDADECLACSLDEVRELLHDTSAEAFTAVIDNRLGPNPEDRLKHRAIRIFQNGRGYQFRGRIHEDIGQSIVDKYGISFIKDSTIRIDHFGYLPHMLKRKNKLVRNETLLQKELSEQPNHPFYLYNMGITCCQAGQLKEAKTYMQKALIHTPDAVPYRATLIRDLSKIMLELQEVQQTEALIRRELLTYPDYSDLFFLLGESLGMQGLLEASREAYLCATEHTNDRFVSEAGINSYRAFTKVAETTATLGHCEDAARWFYKALQTHNTFFPALDGIAEAFLQLNVPNKEIALLLQTIIRPKSTDDYVILSDTLYNIGAFQEIVDSILEAQLTDPRILFRFASALIQSKNYTDANHLLCRYADIPETNEIERLFLLRSICQWQLDGHLHEETVIDIPDSIRGPLCELDQYLIKKSQSTGKPVQDPHLSEWAQKLIRESVSLQCLDLASQLATMNPENLLLYAKELYHLGKSLQSADLLLDILDQKLLDEEGLFMIGELLFDKGHFIQAAEIFETSIKIGDERLRTRTGAALCYLHLAAENLKDAITREPGAQTLSNDLKNINESIQLLNRTSWHTKWIGFRRRIRHEEASHLLVHDREK